MTKCASCGFKMYLVNKSESGCIYKSLLYTGKEMTEKLAGDYKYVATKIVYNESDERPQYWSYILY